MNANTLRAIPLSLVLFAFSAPFAFAQAAPAQSGAQTAAPRQSGTVKAITPHDFVLTTAAGQDVAVTIAAGTRILLVPPGSHDLSAAQPGAITDIAAGDRAIVSGTAGDPTSSLNATRVLVMKSSAIAANREAAQTAWAHGAGGIVKSVDPAAGAVMLSSGTRTIKVNTTPQTVVRRYAGTSVRFEDAVRSSVADIHPGDQLRARGERTPDGNTVTADEIVTGSFSNYSGTLSAVDPVKRTVTLTDLATRHAVTVAVTDASNLRRLPAGAAQMMASHAQAADGAANTAGQPTAARANEGSAGGPHTGHAAGGGAGSGGGAGFGRGGAGADLSRMMNRLPTETLAGLKPGDAVMIVAANNPQTAPPAAINLLVGVEQILAAHPSGETTLSPWNLGGGGEGEADAGAH